MKTNKDIDTLISMIYDWAIQHEALILKDGVVLSPNQEIDAFLAGVKAPNKIRLLKADLIPFPDTEKLIDELNQIGLLHTDVVGLTLGHGIYIKQTHWDRREVLVHEFAHVMQYERLGLKEFLVQYISECLSFGYPFGRLETEARKIEKQICGPNT